MEKRLLAIVLGDAALKHHFWPGRGANSGFKGTSSQIPNQFFTLIASSGSINLSWHFLHYLTSASERACSLLPPDFSKYAAFMSELKLREHEGRGEYITVSL
jgi:hypothetical protein